MPYKITGTVVLYVGGHWELEWRNDDVVKVWRKGVAYCKTKYEGPHHRKEIIERWMATFNDFELGIIPDIPVFKDEELPIERKQRFFEHLKM